MSNTVQGPYAGFHNNAKEDSIACILPMKHYSSRSLNNIFQSSKLVGGCDSKAHSLSITHIASLEDQNSGLGSLFIQLTALVLGCKYEYEPG